MLRHALEASILIALSVASCSSPEGATEKAPEQSAPSEVKRKLPEISTDPAVRSLVDAARANLVERLEQQQTDPGKIVVLNAERVTWRSSAAGCPQPDRGYLMVLTPGVLIRLRAAGQVYQYHSTLRGPPFLCDAGRAETPSPGSSLLDPT